MCSIQGGIWREFHCHLVQEPLQVWVKTGKEVRFRNAFEESKVTQRHDKQIKRPGEDDVQRSSAKVLRGHSETDLTDIGRRMAKHSGDTGGGFHGSNYAIDDVSELLDIAMDVGGEEQDPNDDTTEPESEKKKTEVSLRHSKSITHVCEVTAVHALESSLAP